MYVHAVGIIGWVVWPFALTELADDWLGCCVVFFFFFGVYPDQPKYTLRLICDRNEIPE